MPTFDQDYRKLIHDVRERVKRWRVTEPSVQDTLRTAESWQQELLRLNMLSDSQDARVKAALQALDDMPTAPKAAVKSAQSVLDALTSAPETAAWQRAGDRATVKALEYRTSQSAVKAPVAGAGPIGQALSLAQQAETLIEGMVNYVPESGGAQEAVQEALSALNKAVRSLSYAKTKVASLPQRGDAKSPFEGASVRAQSVKITSGQTHVRDQKPWQGHGTPKS